MSPSVPRKPEPPPGYKLLLDFPVHPEARWGHGRPAHPELLALVEARRDTYAEVLGTAMTYQESYAAIGRDWVAEDIPYWLCGWLSPLDLIVLYSTVASLRPQIYLEVGSGSSTTFVRNAIERHDLPTRIISIDPEPRAEIDAICDEVIRSPLESTDLSVFERLQHGDVVFLDGSHRCFSNSDVTVAFLEVLPRLPAGVVVGIDDVYLPHDYPPDWADRYYSEQYLLAAWLLGGSRRLQLRCANYFASQDTRLCRIVEPLWQELFAGMITGGNSFWVTITE